MELTIDAYMNKFKAN